MHFAEVSHRSQRDGHGATACCVEESQYDPTSDQGLSYRSSCKRFRQSVILYSLINSSDKVDEAEEVLRACAAVKSKIECVDQIETLVE